jgi:hypothetical protein
VDDFVEAIYDIDKSHRRGHLSTHLTVVYDDGPSIRIELNEIGDALFAEFKRDEAFFVVGRGGRTFPRVMNRGTTPQLWSVKQAALQVIDEYNADWELFVSMAMVAIGFVFPPPTAGAPWTIRFRGGARPIPTAAFEKLDGVLTRLSKRLGRPHVPEDGDLPSLKAEPKPPKAPYAIRPDGTEVPPDHHGTVFHGTSEFTPDVVVREGGIPAKPFGDDRRLHEHTKSGDGSAFRGVTPFIRGHTPEAGQGAAEFAVHAADVGYVYQIEGAPVWELSMHLEGRIPPPLPGYRYKSGRPGTTGEVESVTEARVPLRFVTDVYRVTRIEGKIHIEKLDWGLIKATTKTSDIPSSL